MDASGSFVMAHPYLMGTFYRQAARAENDVAVTMV
jgi:hypothetical protein